MYWQSINKLKANKLRLWMNFPKDRHLMFGSITSLIRKFRINRKNRINFREYNQMFVFQILKIRIWTATHKLISFIEKFTKTRRVKSITEGSVLMSVMQYIPKTIQVLDTFSSILKIQIQYRQHFKDMIQRIENKFTVFRVFIRWTQNWYKYWNQN